MTYENLSERAKVAAGVWFSMGSKSTVEIGGVHSKYKLNSVWEDSFRELKDGGFITATPFGAHNKGRMIFKGTERLNGTPRVTEKMISNHNFSIAVPNE